MLENEMCYKTALELKTLRYNCGFLILIYQSHSFWILISNMITYSMKLIFYAEKDSGFFHTNFIISGSYFSCLLS